MILRFGNLTVEQFEMAAGTEFTEEERTALEASRTDMAAVDEDDKFHIFADPLCIVAGWDALPVITPLFTAANDRKPFNRAVSFYPNKAKEGE